MSDEQTKRNEEILASAKNIMDSFFTKLNQETMQTDSFGLTRETQTREPKQTQKNADFKDKILANAPLKNQDYILAEKKSW